jgi:hypothetical protein
MTQGQRIAGLMMAVVLAAALTVWAEEKPATQAVGASQPASATAPATVAATKTSEDLPEAAKGNGNGLLKQFCGRVTMSASTFWPGWPAEKAIDGKLETSWFTARDDAAALDTKPWIKIAFPEAVTVKRVTVLGNREPAWLKGFTIKAGRLELLDGEGRVLWIREIVGQGSCFDFDYVPEKAVAGVNCVRFEARDDEGKLNSYADVAIGEMLVE